jgi:hypothetical protein
VVGVVALVAAMPASADQLRATGRVHPVDPGPKVSIALGTGYGFTGGVLDSNDAHHRIGGSAALAVRVARWLELGGEVRGRYDKHTGDMPDDGFVGDPRLWVAGAKALGTNETGGSWLGLRLGVWLPGTDVPSIQTDAITLDATAVYTMRRGAFTFTGTGGYRLDNSGKSVPDRNLSYPDKLGLGISDYDAILAGAALSRRGASGWDLFGEASWDILVGGSDTPSPMESPLRVGFGARKALDDSVTLEGALEVSASSRPAIDETLVNVEPRVSAIVGLSWHPRPPAKVVPIVVEDEPKEPEPPPPPPPPTTGSVKGLIVDNDGAPLPGATIRLGARTATTGDDGTFTLTDITPGSVDVLVERPGHAPAQRTLTITAGAESQLDVTLTRVRPPSQIKGLVRSFDGKGLAATVRVEPAGVEVVAGADGLFQIDVPPGTYTVVVSMAGYETQKKDVTVEEDGVVFKNVELRKAKR